MNGVHMRKEESEIIEKFEPSGAIDNGDRINIAGEL